jgi:hypothetical protein
MYAMYCTHPGELCYQAMRICTVRFSVCILEVCNNGNMQMQSKKLIECAICLLTQTDHNHFIQWLTQPRFFSREICRNLRAQAPTNIRLILIGQCEIIRISRHFCCPFVVQNQSHTIEYHNTWHVNILIFLEHTAITDW